VSLLGIFRNDFLEPEATSHIAGGTERHGACCACGVLPALPASGGRREDVAICNSQSCWKSLVSDGKGQEQECSMPAKIEGIFAFKAPLPRWMSIWAMQLLHHPRDGESTSTRLWHFQKASHM